MRVKVLAVHGGLDCPPIYYTILCDGVERQTEGERLRAPSEQRPPPSVSQQDTMELLPPNRPSISNEVTTPVAGWPSLQTGNKRSAGAYDSAGENNVAAANGAIFGAVESGRKVRKVDGKLVAKSVRALLRRHDDPSSMSRKELRCQLEERLGVGDLSEWKDAIKEAAVAFVIELNAASKA